MTDPYDDPSAHWGLIFHGSGRYLPSHTRQEWALIADAIGAADLALAATGSDAPGDVAPVRGDAAWCQVAVDTYTRLHTAGAYWRLRPAEAPRCHADEHIIRAWLDAPRAPPADQPLTMLRAGGLDVEFESDRAPDPASISMLVSHAQDIGVFGVAHHRVNLWRFLGDGAVPAHTFTVTVQPPDGAGLSSSLIGLDHLMRAGSDPVDAIVGVLQGVAKVANGLLATLDTAPAHTAPAQFAPADIEHAAPDPAAGPPLPAGVEGHSIGLRGRPFRLLRLDDDTSAACPDVGPPAPFRAPRRRRP